MIRPKNDIIKTVADVQRLIAYAKELKIYIDSDEANSLGPGKIDALMDEHTRILQKIKKI